MPMIEKYFSYKCIFFMIYVLYNFMKKFDK